MRMPLVDMKQSAPETGTVRAIIPDQMSQLQKQNAVVSDNDELRQFDKQSHKSFIYSDKNMPMDPIKYGKKYFEDLISR